MHIQFTENGPYWPAANTVFTPSHVMYSKANPEIIININGKEYREILTQFNFISPLEAKNKADEVIREKINEIGKVSQWITEWWE